MKSTHLMAVRLIESVRFVRWHHVAVIVVMFVAAAPRLLGLPDEIATRDECFSWRMMQYPIRDVVYRTIGDAHPPGYYVVLKCWTSIFGYSMFAMRMLSVLFGLATVPFVYLATHESMQPDKKRPPSLHSRLGALTASVGFALHGLHIEVDRDARMYGMGVFLAALCTWRLNRALNRNHLDLFAWTLYGIAITAFLFTHYFALFTVVAQAIVVVHVGLMRGLLKIHVLGVFVSFLISILLFSPWMHASVAQVHTVQNGFWIPQFGWYELNQSFFAWMSGATYSSAVENVLSLSLVALLMGCSFSRSKVVAHSWLIQAAVPWILCIAISWYLKRPILQVRYLAFAHVSLLALMGTAIAAIRSHLVQGLCGAVLMAACSVNSLERIVTFSCARPAVANPMEVVQRNYRAGDCIVAPSPGELNRLRYFAWQCGLAGQGVSFRTFVQYSGGHVTHRSSLCADEVLWNIRELNGDGFVRFWYVQLIGGDQFALPYARGGNSPPFVTWSTRSSNFEVFLMETTAPPKR